MLKLNAWGLMLAFAIALGASVRAQEPRLTGGAVFSGIGQYEEKVWGTVKASAENPGGQAVTVLMVHQFDSVPNIQFAAEIWIPPRSVRNVWLPVRPGPIPYDFENDAPARGVAITSLLLDHKTSPERQFSREPGLLPVVQSRPVSGVISDVDDDVAIDAIVAMRESLGLGRRMAYLRSEGLPSLFAAWEGLDCLLLCDNDIDIDIAQIWAMRQWLIAGGRMWVMAEQVDPAVLRMIVGEDWTFEIVDRVKLNQFTIEGGRRPFECEFESPVEMARVFAPDMEVQHTIKGWPASMSRQVGLGTLIVTTLSPQGWIAADNEASGPLKEVGQLLMRDPEPPPVSASEFESFVTQQIGYTILSRGPVLAVLAIYCLGLLAVGIVLWRRNRLEHLSIWGVAMAAVASIILLVAGAINRGKVPLTVASTQLVSVVPSQKHVVINGLMSIYSPEKAEGVIEASKGGIVWTDLPAEPSKPLRTIWTDMDHWYWQNFDLPSGAVINAPFLKSEALEQPVDAVGRFTSDGLQIDLEAGPFTDMTDGILATRFGVMRLGRNVPANMTLSPADQTDVDQLFEGSLLTDSDRRRQEIYRSLLESFDFPPVPTIFAWARPMDLGMTLPEQARVEDSALVGIPLTIEKPAPDTRFVLPSMFLPFQSVRDQRGQLVSTIYNNSTGAWVGQLTQGSTVVLRFQPPRQLLPLRVESARVTLDIRAPERTVTIAGYRGSERVELASRKSPSGRTTIDLNDAQLLQPDDKGGIYLAISVNELFDDLEGTRTWLLDHVELEITATYAPSKF